MATSSDMKSKRPANEAFLVAPAIPIIIIGVAPKGKAANTSASPIEGAGQVKPYRAMITASGARTINMLCRGTVSSCNRWVCLLGQRSYVGRSSDCHGRNEGKRHLAHSSLSGRGSYHLANSTSNRATTIAHLATPKSIALCGVDCRAASMASAGEDARIEA